MFDVKYLMLIRPDMQQALWLFTFRSRRCDELFLVKLSNLIKEAISLICLLFILKKMYCFINNEGNFC